MRPGRFPLLLAVLVSCVRPTTEAATGSAGERDKNWFKPNIVYILCDDLGYGDVHCHNPELGKIATLYLDQPAAQGMVVTDAHSSSAVCTPSR